MANLSGHTFEAGKQKYYTTNQKFVKNKNKAGHKI